MTPFESCYIKNAAGGALQARADAAWKRLASCTLCPRHCEMDRLAGRIGFCRTGKEAVVASWGAHFGEEAPLVGQNGSGTIFFSRCNLGCVFCQNYDISVEGEGQEVSCGELAGIMLSLQKEGCHNINLVTPSHVVPQILQAVALAVSEGLNVPLVYNSGGYDNIETLRLLDGVVDIYMPDFKFWDPAVAERACRAKDYPSAVRKALLEMHRQVGDLVVDDRGIARRGLLIRHLVLPRGLAGTRQVMRFVAGRISPSSYVNVMSQYRPCGRAHEIEGLDARLTAEEIEAALRAAAEEGIKRLDKPRRAFMLF